MINDLRLFVIFPLLILLVFAPPSAIHCSADPEDGTAPETILCADIEHQVVHISRKPFLDAEWTPDPAKKTVRPDHVSIIFGYRSENDYTRCDIAFTGATWAILRRLGGEETTVAAGNIYAPTEGSLQAFRVKIRRRWFAIDAFGKTLLRVGASFDGQGALAVSARPHGCLGSFQARSFVDADVVFSDDFMRFPDDPSLGGWQSASGEWVLQSFADKWKGESPLDPTNSTRNANPFVWRGKGTTETPAVAIAGQPFWDDLRVEVSMRSVGGQGGIVFAYQAPENYCRLWWSPASLWETPSALILEQVINGQVQELSRATFMGQREQWYRLGLETCGGRIDIYLQNVLVIRNTAEHRCLQGHFGLCSIGETDFDDVAVRSAPCRPLLEDWQKKIAVSEPEERWKLTDRGLECGRVFWSQSASYIMSVPSENARVIAFTVDPSENSEGTIGLRCGIGGKEEVAFEWDSERVGDARRRLWHRAPNGSIEHFEAEGGYTPEKELRIVLRMTDEGVTVEEKNEGVLIFGPGITPVTGRIAFTVYGRENVSFKDLLLDGSDERDWEKPIRNEAFVRDHYMVDWAAPTGQWLLGAADEENSPRYWWHTGDFYGAAYVELPLRQIIKSDGIEVILFAEDNRPDTGCRIVLSVDGDAGGDNARLAAHLYLRGKEIASATGPLDSPGDMVRVSADGDFVGCLIDGQPLLWQQVDRSILTGTRVGLLLPDEAALESIVLRRDHVVDDPFDRAPTHWYKQGRWEISNKFDCDPRWAYLIGESDGLALLRHLDRFPGDVTLEFYAGMRYRHQNNFMPYYPRPGDINAVFGSTIESVFDGYTAIISGWHTTWTRLLRNGMIVAQSDKELVPKNTCIYPRPQNLHRKWFYVKIRRIGTRFELHFDNQKVLEWSDRNPVPAPYLGLWTFDNSIVIARAKISYTTREKFTPKRILGFSQPEVSTPTAPAEQQEEPVADTTEAAEPKQSTSWTFDTQESISDWRRTNAVDDARVLWEARDDGGCLRIEDPAPGGRFLLPVPGLDGLDAADISSLDFACNIPAGTLVNLYLTVRDNTYFFPLTGPTDSLENLLPLANGNPDFIGQWQNVSIPLCQAIRRHTPRPPSLPISQVFFGILHKGYVRAGWHGNSAGSSYLLDDVRIVKRTAAPNITAELCFPRDPTKWGGTPLEIQLSETPPHGIDGLRATLNGKTVEVTSPVLRYDSRQNIVRIDLNRDDIPLNETGEMSISLAHTDAPEQPIGAWKLTYVPDEDECPPSVPVLSTYPVYQDFETGTQSWSEIPADKAGREHGARIVWDNQIAASGLSSMKLFNHLVGGIAGAAADVVPFDAGKNPLVSFDIRIPQEFMVDMLLTAGGQACRVGLTDTDNRNTAYPLGLFDTLPKPDGRWYHVSCNLRELLARVPCHPKQFDVSSLKIGDGGWTGNPEGASIWIDNFRISPVLRPDGKQELTVVSRDPGGIKGYSYHWSDVPEQSVDRSLDTSKGSIPVGKVADGLRYLHIGAVDNTGNWSETSHWPFLVDSTPPEFSDPLPKTDALSPATSISLTISDPVSGIDSETLKIKVNKRPITLGADGVDVDLLTGRICIDLLRTKVFSEPVPEGKKVTVEISPVTDFAGNTSEPFSWSWSYSGQDDHRPPSPPVITCSSASVLKQLTFEDGKPGLSAAMPAQLTTPIDPDIDSRVLQIHYLAEVARANVAIPGAVDTQKYPYFSFRYRFPPELKMHLTARLTDPEPYLLWMVIEMTDADTRPDYVARVGRLKDIVCDNAWHYATADLQYYLQQQPQLKEGQEPNSWQLKTLSFTDIGFNWNPRDLTLCLDDVLLSGPGKPQGTFKLASEDQSGIEGFSCIVDRSPITDPPTEVTLSKGKVYKTDTLDEGLWYVHARACDKKGNWSSTAHYPYIVGKLPHPSMQPSGPASCPLKPAP